MSVQSAGTLHGPAVVLIIRTGAELRLKRVLNRGVHAWGAAADVPIGFACWISGATSSRCELSGQRLGAAPAKARRFFLAGGGRAGALSKYAKPPTRAQKRRGFAKGDAWVDCRDTSVLGR